MVSGSRIQSFLEGIPIVLDSVEFSLALRLIELDRAIRVRVVDYLDDGYEYLTAINMAETEEEIEFKKAMSLIKFEECVTLEYRNGADYEISSMVLAEIPGVRLEYGMVIVDPEMYTVDHADDIRYFIYDITGEG